MHSISTPIAIAILVSVLGPVSSPAAQFGRIGDAARRAGAAKREAEEAAKRNTGKPSTAPTTPTAPSPAPAPGPAASAGPAPSAPPPAPAASPGFEAFTKFDFVPGEKVVAVEDFTQDAIGDFPARWNTNGAGEVVTLTGRPGRWLKITKGGFYLPEFVTELPDNFTLEFDLTVAPTFDSSYALNVVLVQLANVKTPVVWQTEGHNFVVTFNPRGGGGSSGMTSRQGGLGGPANNAAVPQLSSKAAAPIHVSLWRQRQRVRAYINEEKTWDVPRGLDAAARLNALLFVVPNVDAGMEYYIGNVRFAAGAPDTRNKLLTQGKWVTHGILFDVNSDRIKGESYGSLKEMANVLAETADLKVQIVGHTDADGDDASNLDLSRRRAAAVKTALATQFGIDASRMETDGKGEGEPVDKNDTPAGKANNRRVEFIRR